MHTQLYKLNFDSIVQASLIWSFQECIFIYTQSMNYYITITSGTIIMDRKVYGLLKNLCKSPGWMINTKYVQRQMV